MQTIMAWAEGKKWESKVMGGVGTEIEADCFQLGGKRKNSVGMIR